MWALLPPSPQPWPAILERSKGRGRKSAKGRNFIWTHPDHGRRLFSFGPNLIDKVDLVSLLLSNKVRGLGNEAAQCLYASECMFNFGLSMLIVFYTYFSILFYYLNFKNFTMSSKKVSGWEKLQKQTGDCELQTSENSVLWKWERCSDTKHGNEA